MKKVNSALSSLSVLLVLGACEVAFDPKGPFLDRVVVFGVISPQQNTHVIRISKTYDPPEFNPLEYTTSNQIINAVVSISVDATTTVLQDSTYPRNDTSRYQDSIHAFVFAPASIQRGKAYTLSAAIPVYGTVTATTIPPAIGILEVEQNSGPVLTTPNVARRDITFYAIPADNAEGHMVKVFLEYEVPSLNPGVLVKEEVPVTTTNYVNCLTYDAVYPRIRRRQQVAGREIWTFPYLSYQRTILRILKANDGYVVSFKRVVLALVQADKHLYSYFSLVGGFRDEFSIRVDEPNYTNIQNGLGFFGSYTADSLAITLPPTFPMIVCP